MAISKENNDVNNQRFIERYQNTFNQFFTQFVQKIKWKGDTQAHFPALIFKTLTDYLMDELNMGISRNTAEVPLDLFLNSWYHYNNPILRCEEEETRRQQRRENQRLHQQQRRQPRFIRQHGQRQSRQSRNSLTMDANLHQRHSFAFI